MTAKAPPPGLEIEPDGLIVLTEAPNVKLTDFKARAVWICNGIQAGR